MSEIISMISTRKCLHCGFVLLSLDILRKSQVTHVFLINTSCMSTKTKCTWPRGKGNCPQRKLTYLGVSRPHKSRRYYWSCRIKVIWKERTPVFITFWCYCNLEFHVHLQLFSLAEFQNFVSQTFVKVAQIHKPHHTM